MGGRDLPPGCARLLSQAGEADRVKRGLLHPRGVWANYGAVLLAKEYQEPLYWVSNMATAAEACRLYEKLYTLF